MAELHRTYDEEQDYEAHAPYLKVFFVLLILTIFEYCYALASFKFGLGIVLLILGLMVLAFTKAGLVAWYFMHLKFEGRWVYLMIVPALFMAMFLVLALYPDIALQHKMEVDSVDTEVAGAPL